MKDQKYFIIDDSSANNNESKGHLIRRLFHMKRLSDGEYSIVVKKGR